MLFIGQFMIHCELLLLYQLQVVRIHEQVKAIGVGLHTHRDTHAFLHTHTVLHTLTYPNVRACRHTHTKDSSEKENLATLVLLDFFT